MADIVLRDRNGKPLNFYGTEYLDLVTPDGTEAPYALYDPATLIPENIAEGVRVGDVDGTKPTYEVLENISIALDFSNGDQTISAEEGYLVKSATIQQPENLIPENIPEGLNIAGIIGTLAASGGAKFSFGTVTGASGSITINHGLGVIPDIFILYHGGSTPSDGKKYLSFSIGWSSAFRTMVSASHNQKLITMTRTSAETTVGNVSVYQGIDQTNNNNLNNANEQTILWTDTDIFLVPNNSYRWYAIGGLT